VDETLDLLRHDPGPQPVAPAAAASVKVVLHGEIVPYRGAKSARLPNGGFSHYTPAHVRKYQDALRYACGQAMAGGAPFEGAVRVAVLAVLPVPRSMSAKRRAECLRGERHPVKRPDLDGYLKVALDCANLIVFRDDSQVVDLDVRKVYGDRPRIEIDVSPIGGRP